MMFRTGLCFSDNKQDQEDGHFKISAAYSKNGAAAPAAYDFAADADDKLKNVARLDKEGAKLNKSHQLNKRLQSTLQRLIIAFATFRLTTSTSTSTSSTVAAVTSSSASSLSALLKTLLIGCYYMLAFSSILLIIIYINHVATQANNNKISLHMTSTQPAAASARIQETGSKKQITEALPVPNFNKFLDEMNETSRSSSDQLLLLKRRIKRSISPGSANEERVASFPGNKEAFGRRLNQQASQLQPTKSIASRPTDLRSGLNAPAATNKSTKQSRQQISRNKCAPIDSRQCNFTTAHSTSAPASAPASAHNARQPLPELTERQASRGSQLNSSSRSGVVTSESQWIPILSVPLSTATSQPKPASLARNNRKPMLAAGSALELIEATYLPLELNEYNSRQYYPAAAAAHNRHWRRPSYNYREGRQSQSKMYKRVLLCDKTLVSLDYIRNVGAEPRPYYYGDEDNVIDLDSKPESSVVALFDSERKNASNAIKPTESFVSRSLDEEESVVLGMNIEPRISYLTDEDPLVKCDMWDLEKGLKNRKPPADILRQAIRADFDTVRDANNRCRQLSEKTLPPDDEFRDGLEVMSTEDLISLFSIKRGLIPGTKWCGLGDQASSYNDLGSKHRIDICCRAHDHCPIRLKPFRNDYGVLNIALYTKSHCDCDADFYRCLREVHSRTADMLGNLYFNVMKLQCMREERMKICREVKPIALGFERCVRYEDSPVRTVFRFTTPPVAY